MSFSYYEFFAGAGMVRQGLGPDWTCLFANDFDAKKCASYQQNWGGGELRLEDVNKLTAEVLPGQAHLAWASFPCQDLSLAGRRAGLQGGQSSAFWGFHRLMGDLVAGGRAPNLLALENVPGLLSSHGGADFTALCDAVVGLGYHIGAMMINASKFVPQSRQRLFIVAVKNPPMAMVSDRPMAWCSPTVLTSAVEHLPAGVKDKWVWWRLPEPHGVVDPFSALVEDFPASVSWHQQGETHALLAMMNKTHLSKVAEAMNSGKRMVGTIYKRTRVENGAKVQRAEVRFDDVAGCLRTPGGGSSRQTIMVVDGQLVRSRLISSRETARLMGMPDSYNLPDNYTEAYHLTGDGVCVPVVRYLAEHIFEAIKVTPPLMEVQ